MSRRNVYQQHLRLHQRRPVSKLSVGAVAPSVETGGEFFSDGRSISLVRNLDTERPKLLLVGGRRDVIGSAIEYAGRRYVPPDLSDSFQRALIFPETKKDFGSTAALFTSVKESLVCFGLPEQVALTAVYFLFPSWFVEVLPAAPLLLISGPRAEASMLLALLSCLVRHPLPIVQISETGLRSLPMNLRPTLLIDDELIADSLFRLLSVSSDRNANILVKDGVVNTYSAKALYCGPVERDESFGDAILRINLAPSDSRLPILAQKDRQDLAAKFQALLLGYRTKNIARVARAKFNYPGLHKEYQLLASLLAVCIVDAPEIQAGVGSLLEAQHRQAHPDRWLDLRCVVIEAALSRCHRKQKEGTVVHVKDIAEDAAAILKGRGAEGPLEPRAVGAALRMVGLTAKRDKSGYKFELTDSLSHRIHQLAHQFDVAAAQEGGLVGCDHCKELGLIHKAGDK
jgi:hypothetical protein